MAGRLIVCPTPIGNIGDVSERLRKTLAEADMVAGYLQSAVDQRHTAGDPDVARYEVSGQRIVLDVIARFQRPAPKLIGKTARTAVIVARIACYLNLSRAARPVALFQFAPSNVCA